MATWRFVSFARAYVWRSLGRNPRRTLLTVATIMLAATVTIVAKRYAAAVMGLWQKSSAESGTAHVQVHAAGFAQHTEGLDPALALAVGGPAEAALAGDPNVEAFARRLKFEGIIAAGEKNLYFLGNGVEPQAENAVSPLLWPPKPKDYPRGRFVEDGDVYGITVGQGLADALGLKVGDEATLIAQTIQGSANAIDAKVVGIIQIPLPSFSKRAVFLHIDLARKLVRMPDAYTELAVRVRDVDGLPAWAPGFAARLGAPFELRAWWEIDPIIRKVEGIINSIIGVLLGLLLVSASLSVLNIIFMLVMERTVEIGTLKALGASPGRILRLFTLEAGLLGVLGGAAGVLLGTAIVAVMGRVGVPFDIPFGTGKVDIHPANDGLTTLAAFGVATLVATAAAVLPARRAAQVEPVRAFRGQLT